MTEMTVEAAEQEAAEAEQLAVELEERVRQGDATVTPDAIADAERLGRFARLRVEAAQRKAAERRKAAALDSIEQLKAHLIDQAGEKDGAVVKAWENLVKALGTLQAASDERWSSVEQLMSRRSDVSQQATAAGIQLTDFGILPGRYGRDGFQVKDEGVDVRQVQTHDLVAEALALALSQSVVSGVRSTGTDAVRPDELPSSTRVTALAGWPAAVRRLLKAAS